MKKNVLRLEIIVCNDEIYGFVRACRNLGLEYRFSHGPKGINNLDNYLWYDVNFEDLQQIYWLGRYFESYIQK